MARVSLIKASIDRAMENASVRILQDALNSLPANTEMGRLVDELGKSEYGQKFRTMSLSDFVAAAQDSAAASTKSAPAAKVGKKTRGRKAAAQPGRKVKEHNTRTLEGRNAYLKLVEEFVQQTGTVGAKQVSVGVGGSPQQIRQAMKRLAESGKLKITGEKRLTQYVWGSAAKSGGKSSRRTTKKKTVAKKAKPAARKKKRAAKKKK